MPVSHITVSKDSIEYDMTIKHSERHIIHRYLYQTTQKFAGKSRKHNFVSE